MSWPRHGNVRHGLATPAHAATRTWTAQLSCVNELPANASQARGQALFRLSADGTAITYRLQAANIDNVTAAHIHLGGPEANGPVAVRLFGDATPGAGPVNGNLAKGTITSGDLVGPLAGQSLHALIAHTESGNAYVNLHTNDGVPPATRVPATCQAGRSEARLAEPP